MRVRWATLLLALVVGRVGAVDQPIAVAAASRANQPGELVLLTFTLTASLAARATAVQVRAFNSEIAAFPLEPGTWRALVGIDLDVPPGTFPIEIEVAAGSQPVRTTYSLEVLPKHFATRTLHVDEAFVTPPKNVQPRITRESAELHEIWSHPSPERLWSDPFVRPVDGEAISRFGTRSVFNGKPRNPHGGADFLSPTGTPIEAPGGGRIVLARDLYFTGNTVIIDHGLGLFSLLAHMSAIAAHEGDRVTAGEVVGRVGATGRVTGPHLHWSVLASGARVDPLSVLELLGK